MLKKKHENLYEELSNNYQVRYVAGGAVQNSLRIIQWFRSGEKSTHFIGSVGKDSNAKILRKVCNENDLQFYYYECLDKSTGLCAALILNKERSMITRLDAASHFKYEYILSKSVDQVIQKCSIFYSSGFFLVSDDGLKTLQHVAKHSNNNNKVFCLNFSANFVIEYYSDRLKSLLPLVDIVFC